MPAPDTDAIALDRLVVRTQRGEREAFHALVLATQHEVRLFVSGRAWSPDVIEEAVQAAFVTAFERIATYEPRGTFLSWLKGIALNRLREEGRRRSRHDSSDADSLERVLAEESDLEPADTSSARSETARMQRCLERLAPRARELIERHHGRGVPLDELARQFKQGRAILAQTIARIRRSVRACIESAEEAA